MSTRLHGTPAQKTDIFKGMSDCQGVNQEENLKEPKAGWQCQVEKLYLHIFSCCCVAAQCLLIVTEDNPTSVGKLQDSNASLQNLLDLEGSETAVILLRTVACGQFPIDLILKERHLGVWLRAGWSLYGILNQIWALYLNTHLLMTMKVLINLSLIIEIEQSSI